MAQRCRLARRHDRRRSRRGGPSSLPDIGAYVVLLAPAFGSRPRHRRLIAGRPIGIVTREEVLHSLIDHRIPRTEGNQVHSKIERHQNFDWNRDSDPS